MSGSPVRSPRGGRSWVGEVLHCRVVPGTFQQSHWGARVTVTGVPALSLSHSVTDCEQPWDPRPLHGGDCAPCIWRSTCSWVPLHGSLWRQVLQPVRQSPGLHKAPCPLSICSLNACALALPPSPGCSGLLTTFSNCSPSFRASSLLKRLPHTPERA